MVDIVGCCNWQHLSVQYDDVTGITLLQLLESCTEKLCLHKAARRLFLEDGREVLTEDDLDRDMEVYVSTGEPFKNPIKDMLCMYNCQPACPVFTHKVILSCVFVISDTVSRPAKSPAF